MGELRAITIEIPRPMLLLNVWQRKHWAAKLNYTQKLSVEVSYYLRLAGWRFKSACMPRAMVTIERHSSGVPDYDGMVGGAKPLLDCLVKATKSNPYGLDIIEDDNQYVIGRPRYVSVKCRRGESKTVIKIQELPADHDHEAVKS